MLKEFDFVNVPIVDIVNAIFIDASNKGASDIHYDPWEDFMKIRIRIDGELIDYAKVPNAYKNNLVTRIKILSGMNITESRLPQDGAIKANIGGEDVDMRVSCLPTNKGEKVVIRILDYSKHVSGIESLGFTYSNLRKVEKAITAPNGIVLVTGATGSGKSTTVYSILNKLNQKDINIITVEDPIEMDIEGVNQVQTNSEIGLDFANVLRSILRQDPDIVMIGEIRDTETAKIAVRASITGHLVLSTLHTNDALTTIERLCDMGVERYLLSSSLSAIISQKLARKLCPKCKYKRKATQYEKDLIKRELNYDIDEIWDKKGCDECNNGYKGRIAIHEVLLINEEIKDAINIDLDRKDLRELVYKDEDTYTLLQDGLIKAVQGITTLEEVLKLVELDDSEPEKGFEKEETKVEIDDSIETITM
ncbi:type II secretion system protein E [Firmicutes bacterium CAG:884]|nr:type II secretion system protein E [Firmicutes bacterium CAG:884]